MSSGIVVICPSRGRPQNVARLVDSWRLTDAQADLVVCVDDDDPTLDRYRKLDGFELIVGAPRRFAAWINWLGPELAEQYDIIGMFGDDNVCRTERWDRAVSNAMRPLGVVWGNDLYQRDRLCTAPFVDAAIVRHLGWMAPPGVEHLYVDDTWMAIGEHLGTLAYLPDVVIEHAHPFACKASWDDVYVAANSEERYAEDRAAFEAWRDHRMVDDLAGLR